jgi:hypothetical protein
LKSWGLGWLREWRKLGAWQPKVSYSTLGQMAILTGNALAVKLFLSREHNRNSLLFLFVFRSEN